MEKYPRKTINRVKNARFDSDARKQSIKEASCVLSLAKALLIMVGDVGEATVKSFWPHPYYHVFWSCQAQNKRG